MLVYDSYGDKKNPMVLLLHGAAALDTFAMQYELAEYQEMGEEWEKAGD